MSASKNLRASRTRRSTSVMHLECLEQRLPLAGNITAELTGSTLRLTGDDLANQVVVASAAGGRIALIGQNTTINGSPAVFVTDKAVTNIVAKLNGGDDAIGFGNNAEGIAGQRMWISQFFSTEVTEGEVTDPPPPFDVPALQSAINAVAGGITTFSLPGSLAVATASGNDAIGISGNVGGSVTATLGSADTGNGLVISAASIGGAVKITGGGQNDLVSLAGVTVARRVSADLGDGNNWLDMRGSDGAGLATSIGSFVYAGGANRDTVSLAGNVDVRNDVRISTGSKGDDSVSFYSSEDDGTVKVGGDAVIDTGTGNDEVGLVGGDIRGSLSVTTGGGRDTVTVSSSVAWVTDGDNDPIPQFSVAASSKTGRDLTIDTGAGRDLISIGAASVGRKAEIVAGARNDRVRIDGMQVRRNLFARLGRGDDVVEIMALKASATFLEGGVGANSLSMDTATRTGNRTIKHERFQVVTNG